MAKKRIVQVGLGDFGRRWMKVILAHGGWDYVAIATRDGDVLRRCGDLAELPQNRRFQSLEEVFDAGVVADAVLITTPYFRHAEEVTLAVENGCHVLVEKPLAATLAETLELSALASRSGKTIMVGENYRFGADAQALRNLVADGRIGAPELIVLNYFVRHDFPPDDWRNDYRYPVLMENSTHHFDLVRFITGRNAESVYCRTFATDRTGPWPEPNVLAQFRLSGGLYFAYNASWVYGEFETPWEGDWWIRGTRGSIRWIRDRIDVEAGDTVSSIRAESRDSDHTLTDTFKEFSDALAEGRRPVVDIQDNLETIGMVFAAIESSRQGKPVDVKQLIARP